MAVKVSRVADTSEFKVLAGLTAKSCEALCRSLTILLANFEGRDDVGADLIRRQISLNQEFYDYLITRLEIRS